MKHLDRKLAYCKNSLHSTILNWMAENDITRQDELNIVGSALFSEALDFLDDAVFYGDKAKTKKFTKQIIKVWEEAKG